MSSISSISSNSNAQAMALSSTCKVEELSSTTKQKLEALGIDPSTVTSEAQAQILIAQAEAAQKQNNTGQQEQGGNSSQQELISEAKSLASEVGATVSNQDSLENILSKISDKIEAMAKDPSSAQKAQAFQSELTSLAQRADVIVNTQQNIFNNMEMISVSNKLILGL